MSREMRALKLTEDGLRLDRQPRPMPETGNALIRVTTAGICSTDLELLRGYKGGYRGILGHEFVGIVEAAPGYPEWIGRRVVGEINIGCGECELCRDGLAKHCRARATLGIINHDGAFADYLVLPVANLHAVPDNVADDVAVFTEPLAAALQILEQLHIAPSTRVYQVGCGRLGQLIAQVIAATGCELTLIGRSEPPLELAASLSNVQTLSTARADFATRMLPPAPVVVDVTGSPSGFYTALDLVRPGGTLVMKSTMATTLDDVDMSRIVVDEITILGSRCGPFAPALRALAAGAVTTGPLISGRYPLAAAETAFAHAAQAGALKVLLEMA